MARLVAVGALVVVAVSWWVAAGEPTGWEVDVGRWAFDLPGWTTPPFEAVMQTGSRLAPLLAAVALLVVGWRWRAVAVLGAGFLAWALSRGAKELVDRPRPSAATLGRPIREAVAGPGYPSTHAAVSAGMAVAIVLLGRPRPLVGVAILAVAAATALARVHLGVHWPLDVLGGAAIGSLAAVVAAAVMGRRR